MKKIAGLAIAAIFAASAVYADQESGTNFEGLEAGATIGAGNTDSASSTDSYWLGGDAIADLKNTVTAYGEEAPYAGTVGVPDAYKNDAQNNKYLSVNTVGTLKRTINRVENDTSEPYSDLATAPLFIDTLVKFTPSEIEPAVGDEDKFVMWMDANSNLVARVGAYVMDDQDQTVLQTTNVIFNGTFSADTWYRLTVQILPELEYAVHMVVYIDGNRLSAANYVPYHASMWEDIALGDVPADVVALKQANALFLAAAENNTSISYLGFEGIGSVDDISFTLDTPAFLNGETTLAFTLALGDGVTGITYTISGTEGTQTAVGEINVPVNGTVTVTGITPADWYTDTAVLAATEGATVSDNAFTVAAAGSTGTVSATPVPVISIVGTDGATLTLNQLKAWAAANNIDYSDIAAASESNVLKAYLMNDDSVTPSGLKVASIEKVDDGVEFTFVKTNGSSETEIESDDAINGSLYVWQGDTIEEMEAATPTKVEISDAGVVAIETTKKFFKFKVDLPTVE